jgi:hypothetical protein
VVKAAAPGRPETVAALVVPAARVAATAVRVPAVLAATAVRVLVVRVLAARAPAR